ncbi:TadE/TadG family type IV pilus assembly protein [Stagnihabitans tardus]|uniref:Pilus assembly protein n=1 Tax=Stagnihabitans tardus TaxID=2699202 RepID=A0AAE4YHF3_9RHOB|nr:pilus assembly protein [Stagnihabitans tardus]NBZ89980.1 pilus assembly protein [Stagnihabitans tardus]
MDRIVFRRLRQALTRFAAREDGSVVAEGVIVLPLLIWAFIGLFVYWDAFREMNTVQKAGYTLSDVLSRQQTGVTNAYVVGMQDLFDYLVGDDSENSIRVTSVTRNGTNDKFEVHWSRTTNSERMPALTTTKLQDYIAQIPSMADNDYAVIVEVNVPYTPAFDVGLGDRVFTEFIVTRPRFLHCVPMDNVPCPVS